MRIYIAGPIAGYPLGNKEAFAAAAVRLTIEGHAPLNPHTVEPVQHAGPCPPGPPAGEEGDGVVRHTAPCYMRTDITALLTCDAIYMLTGWELSSGSRTEFEAARAAGLRLMYERPAAIDATHLERQRRWSESTFGPGVRLGVLDHIRKELDEVAEDPTDLEEWADVVILGLDGAWRAGHEPQAIIDAVRAKQAKNEHRTWPDWRTADPDFAIEHVPDGGAE